MESLLADDSETVTALLDPTAMRGPCYKFLVLLQFKPV